MIIVLFFSEVKVLESKRDALVIADEESISTYYKMRQQIEKLANQMQVNTCSLTHMLP